MKQNDLVITPQGYGRMVAARWEMVAVRLLNSPFETWFLEEDVLPVPDEETWKAV